MAKEGMIEVAGTVQEVLPNTQFRVRLLNGADALAYAGGKMRQRRVRIIAGDRVGNRAFEFPERLSVAGYGVRGARDPEPIQTSGAQTTAIGLVKSALIGGGVPGGGPWPARPIRIRRTAESFRPTSPALLRFRLPRYAISNPLRP